MTYADTPLTPAVREAVARSWGISTAGAAERLFGGEESTSYRVGDWVIRVGPRWRGSPELEWAYGIAAAAAVTVPEVPAPRPVQPSRADLAEVSPAPGTLLQDRRERRRGGRFVVRVEGRPVSVWPYVAGTWADDGDPAQRVQAARLLARLHRALAGLDSVGLRPGRSELGWLAVPQPEVADAELDRWLAGFMARRPAHQPLHGDVYSGNVLVREGRIAGLVDWDDVLLGPPEQELAWAAAEWGELRHTRDLGAAKGFVEDYLAAGGTAGRLLDEELVQLVRGRIRMEVNYSHATGQWGASDDPEEREYDARQLAVFRALRP